MAYVTFNSVRAINVYHQIYHGLITFNCETCNKILPTPNALQLQKYSHLMKQHKCSNCNLSFTHPSKLRQHRRSHVKHKMYLCFHGSCNKRYKHPQDLIHHKETHQPKGYECELCDKSFSEKRLLRCHIAVHEVGFRYFCACR